MKDRCVFTTPLLLRSVAWRRPTLVLVGVVLLASLPVGMALGFEPKAPLAYVTQRDTQPNAGSVAIVDTSMNEVVATVEVGPGPHGMVTTSNGRRAYVVNYGTFNELGQATSLSDTVSVLQLLPFFPHEDADGHTTPSPRVIATVKVGLGPLGVAITPHNTEVYVTNFGTDNPALGAVGNTVSVIKTWTNKVVARIPVGELPAGVAITPDGSHAYVTNRGDDTVSVIDTKTHTVVTTVPVQFKPANVAITPDGRHAYVTNFGDPLPIAGMAVSVIATATNKVIATIPGVGPGPLGVAVTPNGAHVYVVNVLGNNVSVIETATNTVIKTVAVGPGPRAVAITPDGVHAYVTNFFSDTVSVIDTSTNTVVDTVPVVGGPNWVTIPSRHRKAYKQHH